MSDLVDGQLADAINALLNRDPVLAERVTEQDRQVDALEQEIDAYCEQVLERRGLQAAELRLVMTAIKINRDLERIGDHCKSIARKVPSVLLVPDVLARTYIRDMADASRAMLHDVQEAFLQRDRLLARKVIAYDLRVDRLYRDNWNFLIASLQERPEQAEAVAHLITVNKGLERISDHVKNIAESLIFAIEGVDVRHRRLQASDAWPPHDAERPR